MGRFRGTRWSLSSPGVVGGEVWSDGEGQTRGDVVEIHREREELILFEVGEEIRSRPNYKRLSGARKA